MTNKIKFRIKIFHKFGVLALTFFLLSTNASDKDDDTKLCTMAARMRVCGCKNLDEKSFAMSASVAMMNNGWDAPDTMLRHTRRLKDLFSKMPSHLGS